MKKYPMPTEFQIPNYEGPVTLSRKGVKSVSDLVIRIIFLCVCACFPGAVRGQEEPTDAATQVLHDAAADQNRAVILFNEALLTFQSADRASAYRGTPSSTSDALQADLAAFETRLDELDLAYRPVHQAHGLLMRSREGGEAPILETAQSLMDDAEALRSARESFAENCRQILLTAEVLHARAREGLRSVQDRSALLERRFTDKPAPAVDADGNLDGLFIDVAADPGSPGGQALGSAYKASYEMYDRSYTVPPTEYHDSLGLRTLLVVPCAVHRWTHCDNEWYQAHSHLPITRESAKRYTGTGLFELDFRHPEVLKMLERYLLEVAAKYKGDERVMGYLTAWEPQGDEGGPAPWGHWSTGGRTPAGETQFREAMKAKFGTIEALNEAWKSEYENFEAIVPPPDIMVGPNPERAELVQKLFSGSCPPLYYEFNRFLKDSYADYLAWCYRTLKEADPTHAVGISPSYGELDGYLGVGRDSFRWADTASDMYGSELNSSLDEVFNWSVSRASGKVNAIFECVWNSSENWNHPNEAVTRALARRNLWRMTAWGRRLMSLYGAEDTYGGSSYNNLMVYETDFRLMRRSGGVIEPLRRKLRAAEDVWFGAPIVEPEIAIIKPTTSEICSWSWEGVTRVIGRVHNLLYDRNYHYVFIPEEHVISGRESLKRFKAVILPNATHFPAGLTERLLPWVEEGGALISIGIAGGFTPYGEEDGALMKTLFGDISYAPWFTYGEFGWLIQISGVAPHVEVDGKSLASTLSATYGKGRALLINRLNLTGEGDRYGDMLYQWLDAAAPRRVRVEGSTLEVILRENRDGLYVTLINPHVHDTATATVHVDGSYKWAIDRGIEGGVPVPHERNDGMTNFNISLAPGEGTLIELRGSRDAEKIDADYVIECIGDSITAGSSTDPASRPYPEELVRLLGAGHRVINSGVPGAHTYSMVERFLERDSEDHPQCIVVLAGVNDINLWDGQRGSLYGPGALIERLRALGVTANRRGGRTLFATIWPDDDFSDEKLAAMREVNEWILTRAPYEVPGATSIDLMLTMTGQPGETASFLLQPYHDGSHIHLNAEGHKKVAAVIAGNLPIK